jgi:hypothetical protein
VLHDDSASHELALSLLVWTHWPSAGLVTQLDAEVKEAEAEEAKAVQTVETREAREPRPCQAVAAKARQSKPAADQTGKDKYDERITD